MGPLARTACSRWASPERFLPYAGWRGSVRLAQRSDVRQFSDVSWISRSTFVRSRRQGLTSYDAGPCSRVISVRLDPSTFSLLRGPALQEVQAAHPMRAPVR